MLRGSHKPCPRVIGNAGLWPLLERGHKSILCELLGKTDIAHDPRETGDDFSRLNPPDCVNRTMCIGSGHNYPSHYHPSPRAIPEVVCVTCFSAKAFRLARPVSNCAPTMRSLLKNRVTTFAM